MARPVFLIFAKYPQPGVVNTRMIPRLSPEAAAGLHAASLMAVCERLGRLDGVESVLVGTPDERCDDLQRMVSRYVSVCYPQGAGSLGERLKRATDRAFARGVPQAVLVGADSPTLPEKTIADAISGLETHEAVLGPADDGGYYLLGMRRRLTPLFDQIDWGTPRVADQTRRRALALGIDLKELPAWYDLDRFEDLERAALDLAGIDEVAFPAAGALRTLIGELIGR